MPSLPRPQRRLSPLLLVALLIPVAVLLVGTADSFSSGAPPGAAQGGCTCHGPASEKAQLTVAGFPPKYEPNTTYNITVTVAAPFPAQTPIPIVAPERKPGGGLLVTVSNGSLAAGPGLQLRGDRHLTHTASSHEQRSWAFSWKAPPAGGGNVTVHVFSLASNGNAKSDGDDWTRTEFRVPESVAPAPPTSAPPPKTPGVATPLLLLAVATSLLLIPRRE